MNVTVSDVVYRLCVMSRSHKLAELMLLIEFYSYELNMTPIYHLCNKEMKSFR